jgi:hypothetical protein
VTGEPGFNANDTIAENPGPDEGAFYIAGNVLVLPYARGTKEKSGTENFRDALRDLCNQY